MRETIDIFGVLIDKVDTNSTLERIKEFINGNEAKAVFTPNSEMIMIAKNDPELKNVLNSADLSLGDGIGVVLASRILGRSLPERVTGTDTMMNLFKLGSNGSISFYLFGAAPGVADLAVEKLKEMYPKINIVGTHNGFFNAEEEKNITQEINELAPDVLIVGLGAPKQEKWIYKNKENLKVKVCMGLGGSIDIAAGVVKRAPKIFQKLGLEWFYRFMKRPIYRFKRMLKLPQFGLTVLWARFIYLCCHLKNVEKKD